MESVLRRVVIRHRTQTGDGSQTAVVTRVGVHLEGWADVDPAKAILRRATLTVHDLLAPAQIHARMLTTRDEGQSVQRKQLMIAAWVCVAATLVGTIGACFWEPEGTTRTLCELRDSGDGAMFVVARYDGLGSGWNVAFFHRDPKQNWLGFYLAHESPKWRDVQLQRESNLLFVKKGARKVAEYNIANGEFNNLLQRKVYSREEGQVESRQGPTKWGLQ